MPHIRRDHKKAISASSTLQAINDENIANTRWNKSIRAGENECLPWWRFWWMIAVILHSCIIVYVYAQQTQSQKCGPPAISVANDEN